MRTSSRWVTRPEGPVYVHANVKYTEVLFAGSDKFSTKKVVRGVEAAAAEGGPTHDTATGCLRWIPKDCTGWSNMATA